MHEQLALIFRALAFAARRHRDQRRKDVQATPYINHPIELAELLINDGEITDVNVIAAAILHDTVEDTETTIAELENMFGSAIAGIVGEVTDDKSLSKAERKRLQIEHAATRSDAAKLVKLADKICNLRDMLSFPPADWPQERIRAYFDWAHAVIQQVRGVHPQLERLFDAEYARKP
ncbi:MAG: Metal dependent phosphohydrolase [Gammaproteobacteria bacterium]|nr:Metal dependent phosphohydrolase [Gammaproteobacteria bacterium]